MTQTLHRYIYRLYVNGEIITSAQFNEFRGCVDGFEQYVKPGQVLLGEIHDWF